MGTVLLGRRIPDGQPVVIKLMRPNLSPTHTRRNFEHETTLLARFHHPNAVALYDSDLLSDPPFLILEYVPGVSLSACSAARHASTRTAPAASWPRSAMYFKRPTTPASSTAT